MSWRRLLAGQIFVVNKHETVYYPYRTFHPKTSPCATLWITLVLTECHEMGISECLTISQLIPSQHWSIFTRWLLPMFQFNAALPNNINNLHEVFNLRQEVSTESFSSASSWATSSPCLTKFGQTWLVQIDFREKFWFRGDIDDRMRTQLKTSAPIKRHRCTGRGKGGRKNATGDGAES